MIKIIGVIIKVGFFSAAVLILGHYIRWGGETVSDQVKIRVSHAENSATAGKIRGWTRELIDDAHQAAQNLEKSGARRIPGSPPSSAEKIAPTERQKLRALIRELNNT